MRLRLTSLATGIRGSVVNRLELLSCCRCLFPVFLFLLSLLFPFSDSEFFAF